jgi:hypothetical protein
MPVGLQPTGISGIYTVSGEALIAPNASGKGPGYFLPLSGQKIPGNHQG